VRKRGALFSFFEKRQLEPKKLRGTSVSLRKKRGAGGADKKERNSRPRVRLIQMFSGEDLGKNEGEFEKNRPGRGSILLGHTPQHDPKGEGISPRKKKGVMKSPQIGDRGRYYILYEKERFRTAGYPFRKKRKKKKSIRVRKPLTAVRRGHQELRR